MAKSPTLFLRALRRRALAGLRATCVRAAEPRAATRRSSSASRGLKSRAIAPRGHRSAKKPDYAADGSGSCMEKRHEEIPRSVYGQCVRDGRYDEEVHARTAKKGMEAWVKWMDHNKASFVDRGAPVGKTKRVDSKGTKDAKNDVCGYSIVQAKSADQAAKMFGKDPPHFQMPGAYVEVIEFWRCRERRRQSLEKPDGAADAAPFLPGSRRQRSFAAGAQFNRNGKCLKVIPRA